MRRMVEGRKEIPPLPRRPIAAILLYVPNNTVSLCHKAHVLLYHRVKLV
jgi:hypothetical protein